MAQPVTQNSILKPFAKLFQRFHFTLFFVIAAAGIGGAVFLMNDTLEKTINSTDYTSPISAGVIDQATLERIETLHTSTEQVDSVAIPPGRINPFGE